MIKLMIVDDSQDICNFVKNFFAERDFQVLAARDRDTALRIMESEKPEIVLLDLLAPGQNGMDALKRIRKINLNTKVVMITSTEDKEMAEEAKKHGAVEYITKPLLLEQLERVVLTIAEQIKTKAQNTL